MRSTKLQGLTNPEVELRIQRGEVNFVAENDRNLFRRIFLGNLFNVFNIVNAGVIVILLFYAQRFNDIRLVYDSVGIFTVSFVNTALAIWQEIKAHRLLQEMSILKDEPVNVLRDRSLVSLKKTDLVKDDIVFIKAGEQIPADGIVLEEHYIRMDESLLTGEGDAVSKKPGEALISGSICVNGNCYYRVTMLGSQSYANKLSALAGERNYIPSVLQGKINIFFVTFFILSLTLTAANYFFSVYQGIEITPDSIRRTASIAIALLPEGLVFFSSLTFIIGIYRISKMGAIVRKLNAMDTFSSVNLLCFDKTGTITTNTMKLSSITFTEELDHQAVRRAIGAYSQLVNETNPTISALQHLPYEDDIRIIDEYPFNSFTKIGAMKVSLAGKETVLFLGSYDSILPLLEIENREEIEELHELNNLSSNRNLIFGYIPHSITYEQLQANSSSINFVPAAIISLQDGIREGIADALKFSEENGIDIRILSGDSTESVNYIIKQAGINVSEGSIVEGPDLFDSNNVLTNPQLAEAKVFTRLTPQHKLLLVNYWKEQGKTVGFVGDGLNDLPVIKKSHLGIAMHEGASVTKNAADIVLKGGSFTLLQEIFNEGNKITNTVRYVGELLLIKNFVVMQLLLLSWFSLIEFVLTPRSNALLSSVAVGIPMYFTAFFNDTTTPAASFLRRIVVIGFISALLITLSHTFIIWAFPSFSNDMLFTGLVITLLFNYPIVLVFELRGNKHKPFVVAFLLLVVYGFLLVLHPNVFPLTIILEFYEIPQLSFASFAASILLSLPVLLLLVAYNFILHKKKLLTYLKL